MPISPAVKSRADWTEFLLQNLELSRDFRVWAAKTAANPGWMGSFFCGSRMKREPSYADVSAAADGMSWCSGLRGFPVFLQQPFGSLAQPRIYCDEKNIKNGLLLYRGYAGGMLYRFPLHLFCFKVIKQGAHFIC